MANRCRESKGVTATRSSRAAPIRVSNSCARPRLPEYPTTNRPSSPRRRRVTLSSVACGRTQDTSAQLGTIRTRAAAIPAANSRSRIDSPRTTFMAARRNDRLRAATSRRSTHPGMRFGVSTEATSGNRSCSQLTNTAPRNAAVTQPQHAVGPSPCVVRPTALQAVQAGRKALRRRQMSAAVKNPDDSAHARILCRFADYPARRHDRVEELVTFIRAARSNVPATYDAFATRA